MQRQQHHAGQQAQLRRDQGDLGEIGDLLDVLERMRTIMRALGQQVVAELLSPLRGCQVLLVALPHVVAFGVLAPDDQAEFHHCLRHLMRSA
jgi:hypothetical protein